MALIIIRGALPDQYLVMSGGLVVGSFQLIPPRGLPNDRKWQWGTSFVVDRRTHVFGDVTSPDMAERYIREQFAKWLAWANLKEAP